MPIAEQTEVAPETQWLVVYSWVHSAEKEPSMNSQVTIGQQSGGFAAGCQFRRSRAAEREIGHYTGFKVATVFDRFLDPKLKWRGCRYRPVLARNCPVYLNSQFNPLTQRKTLSGEQGSGNMQTQK